jgi:hypothetical protein
VSTAARLLSFASFETNRFLGLSSTDRALVLWYQPWMVPFAIVVAAAGIAQPLWMAWTMVRRRSTGDAREWRSVRLLVAGSVLLVYASFFLSIRGPQAHSFYVMFPVAVLCAASCWQVRAEARGGRLPGLERIAATVLAASVVMHAGIAIHRWPRLSLYVNRPLAAAAIENRNDRYLGDRRVTIAQVGDGEPRPIDAIADPIAFASADPLRELEVVRTDWIPFLDRFSSFTIAIRNRSAAAAWVDIRYGTSYLGSHGQLLTVRNGVIKHILQPGETRTFDRIADGAVPPGATSAAVTIVGAEKVIPASLSSEKSEVRSQK